MSDLRAFSRKLCIISNFMGEIFRDTGDICHGGVNKNVSFSVRIFYDNTGTTCIHGEVIKLYRVIIYRDMLAMRNAVIDVAILAYHPFLLGHIGLLHQECCTVLSRRSGAQTQCSGQAQGQCL